MTPAEPDHGEIAGAITTELRLFVCQHKLGRVMVGETGIYTHRNPDTLREADVLFISHERYAQKTHAAYLDVAPGLVVEVLSPTIAGAKE